MINLEKKEETKTITVFDQEYEVKQNISTELKYAIAATAIGGCIRNGVFIRHIFESSLYALMVINYSNFEYQNMGKENILDVYDTLEQNGVIQQVKNAIPEEEFRLFLANANDVFESFKNVTNSTAKVIETFLDQLVSGSALLERVLSVKKVQEEE